MAVDYDYYEQIDKGNGTTETRYYRDGEVVMIQHETIRFGKPHAINHIPLRAPADEWPDEIE